MEVVSLLAHHSKWKMDLHQTSSFCQMAEVAENFGHDLLANGDDDINDFMLSLEAALRYWPLVLPEGSSCHCPFP